MKRKTAVDLHANLPPDYYERSLKRNPLQWIWHHRRFRNISQLIEPVKGKVLDIGSADGTFTKVIAEKSQAQEVIGIDILEKSVQYAKQRFKKNKRMRFVTADAQALPFKDDYFAAVFCLEVAEHLAEPLKVFQEINRVLKPDGYFIVLVPTDSWLFKKIWWVVLHTWGKHWQGTHLQSFHQPGSLARIMKQTGFKVVKEKKFLLKMLEAIKVKKQ